MCGPTRVLLFVALRFCLRNASGENCFSLFARFLPFLVLRLVTQGLTALLKVLEGLVVYIQFSTL